MIVSVIDISLPDRQGILESAERTPYAASVLLDLDGVRQWFELTIKPHVLRGVDADLVVAGDALLERFRSDQRTLHQICKLVGRVARNDTVHLPQRLAA